ncbi:MAG: hypothetical protein DDG60_10790 [Anaerolineae bacterium]|nr:MAG: hypothetical protein DDG60_10790 [Anaerolineae bacterium]
MRHTYLQNLLELARGRRNLYPHLAMYYITTQCNLNCTYCEEFGARRNQQMSDPPGLETAQSILRVLRGGISRLWITGGEPLLVPYLLDLLKFAKKELQFRQVTLLTNGTLLHKRLDLLPYLDQLVVSLDSTDPAILTTVGLPAETALTVRSTVQQVAKLQKRHRFQLILNAVLTPETLPGMEALLEFCQTEQILLSFSPQSFNHWPHYALLTHPEYHAFLKRMLAAKQRGAPLLVSRAFLQTLLEQTPFDCHPTLLWRILPDGWLMYPCHPMEKAGNEQGGRPVNLLQVKTWQEAWKIAHARYGDPPTGCHSCFQQCYAEPSLMQSRPLEMLQEQILYGRGFELSAYAPG